MGPLSSVNIGACWLSFPSAKRDTALLRCYRSGDGRKQATSVPLYKCERQPRHAFAFAVDCLRASQYAPHALPDTSVKFAVAGVCTLRSWPCRGWLRMLRSHMPGPRLRLQQHRARRGRQLRTPRMANCQAPQSLQPWMPHQVPMVQMMIISRDFDVASPHNAASCICIRDIGIAAPFAEAVGEWRMRGAAEPYCGLSQGAG